MLKVCTKCNIEKDISEFSHRKERNSYRTICRSCERVRENKRYAINVIKIKKSMSRKKYYEKNKEKLQERHNKYYHENKVELLKKHKKYELERLHNDVEYKISSNLRNRIRIAIRNNYKSGRSIDLLGCSIKDFKNYLGICRIYNGKLFHLDHIIACNLYDLSVPEEQYKCFNWRNLRLLPAKENLSKGYKLDMKLVKAHQIQDLLPNKIYKEIAI